MSAFDDDFDGRFSNPLAAYKPRAWGEGQQIGTATRSRPEPTSKTNVPKKRIFAKNLSRPLATPLTSIHDFAHSHYNKP
jgi:hypothetical protein